MRRIALAAGWLVAVLVTGCSPTLDEAGRGFAAAPVCCASPQDFTYDSLQPDVRVDFTLDAQSPAWNFPGGKSYYRAFALPVPSYPYTLVISSYFRGENIHSAYVLAPQVLLFDERFRLVRSSTAQQLRLKPAGVGETWGLPYKLELNLNFSSAHAGERYAVIVTSDELRGSTSMVSSLKVAPIVLPGMVGAVPTGSEEVLIPHAPVGELEAVLIPSGESP